MCGTSPAEPATGEPCLREKTIAIRSGRKDDEPHIRAFTRDTFSWGDYVGEVFGAWVEEPPESGAVYVAELDGIPVGVTHVRYLSDWEAWFEGIRVDPEYRTMGIGSMLTQASIQGARKRGIAVCRAAIAASNEPSMSLAKRFGFVRVATITPFVLECEIRRISDNTCRHADNRASAGYPRRVSEGTEGCAVESCISVRKAIPEDVMTVQTLVSKAYAFVGSEYVWRRVSREAVSGDIAAGKVIVACKGADLIAGAWTDHQYWESNQKDPEEGRVWCELYCPFGDAEGIRSLVRFMQRQALSRYANATSLRIYAMVEEGSSMGAVLGSFGFNPIPDPDEIIGIWELYLVSSKGAQGHASP